MIPAITYLALMLHQPENQTYIIYKLQSLKVIRVHLLVCRLGVAALPGQALPPHAHVLCTEPDAHILARSTITSTPQCRAEARAPADSAYHRPRLAKEVAVNLFHLKRHGAQHLWSTICIWVSTNEK